MMHYFIHPRSYTISTTQYVGDTCREKENSQGHVRPKSSDEQFFTSAINTPVAVLTSFTPLDLTPPLELPNPSAVATCRGKSASTNTYGDRAPFWFGGGRRSREE